MSLATERKLTAAVGSKAAEELKAAADAALMPFKSGSDCRAENSGLLLKQVAVAAAVLKAEASAKASVSLATERKLTAAVGSKAAEELKAAADAALMPFLSLATSLTRLLWLLASLLRLGCW